MRQQKIEVEDVVKVVSRSYYKGEVGVVVAVVPRKGWVATGESFEETWVLLDIGVWFKQCELEGNYENY